MPTNQEFRVQIDPPRDATDSPERLLHGLVVHDGDDLPTIDDNDLSLAALLRNHSVKQENGSEFWPIKLLRHILTRDRVLAKAPDVKQYIDYIRPADERATSPAVPSYLQVFALLILLERGEEIGDFIQLQLCDAQLPVHSSTVQGRVQLYGRKTPDQPFECFKTRKWKDCDKEFFADKQWRFLVPYFELGSDDKAQHYELHNSTILPWRHWKDYSPNSLQPSGQQGGYGFVSAVNIEPSSHGFHNILRAIRLKNNCFAMKALDDKEFNDRLRFMNEVEQLKRFSGLAHEHLVTLLATFTFQRRYYFLFPYADCDLDQYWETQERTPAWGQDTVQWIAKQFKGLMGATDIIHEPRHLQLNVQRYGRHGDIKPENVLWFRSLHDPRGILVLSDMGLSSFNRDTSRSNIPNSKIPVSPGYRPPECDIEGGTVSRAYDIWTLGCLFLEMLTWLLGGHDFVEEFQEYRMSVYITGAENNIFFAIKVVEGSNPGHVAQVKEQVTQWINKLHLHPKCSEFVHEVLDVISDDMLVVLSAQRKRSGSTTLRRKFDEIYSRSMRDLDYCLKGMPIRRPFRVVTAVEADLNETSKKALEDYNPRLPTYSGKKNKSILPTDDD